MIRVCTAVVPGLVAMITRTQTVVKFVLSLVYLFSSVLSNIIRGTR
jgi:hypothetical protein